MLVAAGDADDVGVRVDRVAVEHLVEAAAGDAVGLREALGVGVLGAVVDDLDRKAAEVADGRERLADVPAADDEERRRAFVDFDHHLVRLAFS